MILVLSLGPNQNHHSCGKYNCDLRLCTLSELRDYMFLGITPMFLQVYYQNALLHQPKRSIPLHRLMISTLSWAAYPVVIVEPVPLSSIMALSRFLRRILNRSREPLDLVLVSGTAEANDKATKATFFQMKRVCSLSERSSPANAPYLGSVTTANHTDTRPDIVAILRAALNAWEARVLQKEPLCSRRPRRAERLCARSQPFLCCARAAAGPRSVPATAKQNQTSTADDLKQIISVISIIDTNELAILTKKFRAATNSTEKLISLIEYASLVEAIINNKF
ncbi:hypothetical protein EVAR_15844_1 [Eumeta japonica]|uniref:Uncharacterized protein n=1 Tax=Eumeta variegata TaxID=151549 RepID=A0A4C1UE38_EUMVA|nr:hypothetical protein EVAR_15844_1 [Eumeta japonica]